MLQTQDPGRMRATGQDPEFDARVKVIRTSAMIAMGLFAGTVLGGVIGLFVGPVVLAVSYTLLVAWVDEALLTDISHAADRNRPRSRESR